MLYPPLTRQPFCRTSTILPTTYPPALLQDQHTLLVCTPTHAKRQTYSNLFWFQQISNFRFSSCSPSPPFSLHHSISFSLSSLFSFLSLSLFSILCFSVSISLSLSIISLSLYLFLYSLSSLSLSLFFSLSLSLLSLSTLSILSYSFVI